MLIILNFLRNIKEALKWNTTIVFGNVKHLSTRSNFWYGSKLWYCRFLINYCIILQVFRVGYFLLDSSVTLHRQSLPTQRAMYITNETKRYSSSHTLAWVVKTNTITFAFKNLTSNNVFVFTKKTLGWINIFIEQNLNKLPNIQVVFNLLFAHTFLNCLILLHFIKCMHLVEIVLFLHPF